MTASDKYLWAKRLDTMPSRLLIPMNLDIAMAPFTNETTLRKLAKHFRIAEVMEFFSIPWQPPYLKKKSSWRGLLDVRNIYFYCQQICGKRRNYARPGLDCWIRARCAPRTRRGLFPCMSAFFYLSKFPAVYYSCISIVREVMYSRSTTILINLP